MAPFPPVLPRSAPHLALDLPPLALLFPAPLLLFAAELFAVLLLRLLEFLPVAEELLDLPSQRRFVKRGRLAGVLRLLDLLLEILDLLPGDGLLRVLQPFLKVLFRKRQLRTI